MSWFHTPKQKFLAGFYLVMALLSCGLMIFSLFSGTEIVNKVFVESKFENEALKKEDAPSFTLKRRAVCELDIEGITLDQSWIWLKVMILDEQGRPVHDYAFNLSYYHGHEGGESWSEGDRDGSESFILPKGTYSVVVYGEDDKGTSLTRRGRQGYYTVERDERVRVQVRKGVWMTRYFLMLFLVFTGLFVGYIWLRSERAKFETPTTYDP